MHRRALTALILLASLALTGCSASKPAAATASTAAPSKDFSQVATAAADDYYQSHTDALAGAAGVDRATVFKIAKDYCKSVALEGRQATNDGYLQGTDGLSQDTVLAYQELARRYCPVTMRVAG